MKAVRTIKAATNHILISIGIKPDALLIGATTVLMLHDKKNTKSDKRTIKIRRPSFGASSIKRRAEERMFFQASQIRSNIDTRSVENTPV